MEIIRMRQNSLFGNMHEHYKLRFAKCNKKQNIQTDDKHNKIAEYI